MTGQPEELVVLVIPRDEWEVLSETLELDSQSAAFDRELRQDIRSALDSVVECDNTAHVALMILSGIVDEVHVSLSEAAAETALIGWLRGQAGIPDDLTIDQWWAMKEAGEAPQAVEDCTIYEVPLTLTKPEEDAT